MSARTERYAAAIRGCDPDLIAQVEGLDDAALANAVLVRSGLGPPEFAEEVLFKNAATFWRYRQGERPLPGLIRRFLRRELIRALQRSRTGTLPVESWCPACGRGLESGEGVVVYVTGAIDNPNRPDNARDRDGGGEHHRQLGESSVAVEEAGQVEVSDEGAEPGLRHGAAVGP